jgi:ankyrin repeat protein
VYAAACEGYGRCVAMLIEHECDLDLRSADGCSALLIASAKGHGDIVAILLTNGALVQPDQHQWMGLGAHELAREMCNDSVLKILEKPGDMRAEQQGQLAAEEGQLAAEERCIDWTLGTQSSAGSVSLGGGLSDLSGYDGSRCSSDCASTGDGRLNMMQDGSDRETAASAQYSPDESHDLCPDESHGLCPDKSHGFCPDESHGFCPDKSRDLWERRTSL